MESRKLELAVVASVIGIAAFLLLRSLADMQREIEIAAVQSEVSALRVELLDRLAHREAAGGALPAGRNPVVWAARAPGNYAGERDDAPAESGVWYYDRRKEHLVYRFRAGDEWRFRLAFGGRGDAPGVLAGVGLMRVGEAANVK